MIILIDTDLFDFAFEMNSLSWLAFEQQVRENQLTPVLSEIELRHPDWLRLLQLAGCYIAHSPNGFVCLLVFGCIRCFSADIKSAHTECVVLCTGSEFLSHL